MSVRVEPHAIVLEGACPAQDAEDLLRALRDDPAAPVDMGAVTQVHTAVVQIVLALAPRILRKPAPEAFRHDILHALIWDSDSAAEIS
jgi:tripartite-type tricarboxylate transporter receptor subunit TctC